MEAVKLHALDVNPISPHRNPPPFRKCDPITGSLQGPPKLQTQIMPESTCQLAYFRPARIPILQERLV